MQSLSILVSPLQKNIEEKLFIIDDTNEDKKGKLIRGCELTNLAISMDFFIQILVEISQNIDETQENEKANMILAQLIHSLGICTQSSLGFMCKS